MTPRKIPAYAMALPVAPSATVPVVSPWYSKINWVQVVTVALSSAITLISGHAFGFSDATTVKVLGALNLLNGVVTVILKTWFTSTVTPQSVQ